MAPTRLVLLFAAAAGLSAQSLGTNLITTVAGTDPYTASRVDALSAVLPPGPWGKPAIDAAGNIYISLTRQHVVVRLTPAGVLERFAGNGFPRHAGDGGPAALASLNFPRDIAVDSRGAVYIADSGNRRIRRVLPSGIISTYAGGGTLSPTSQGVKLVEAALPSPSAIAVDGLDNLYFAIDAVSLARVDYGASQLRLFAGQPGVPGSPEPGPLAAARFRQIASLTADKAGTLYLTDSVANAIFQVPPAGRLENVTTRAASIGSLADIAVDAAGVLYFTQPPSPVVWRLQPHSFVEAFAGNANAEGFSPNGTPRERALFGGELRLAIDARGVLVAGDQRNGRLRRIATAVDTIAGSDLQFFGEGGPASAAVFYTPAYLAQARSGTLYVSDPFSRLVLAIDSKGTLRRFAGSGWLNAPFADGRAALEGVFGAPYGIAVDSAGTVYIADDDCAIRRIGSDGAMRLHAGLPGSCGRSGDGVPLRDARFGRLRGLTIDSGGSMYVTDVTYHKVWRISPDGIVRTFAGTGSPGTTTTPMPAVQAALNTPLAVAVAADGTVYISDSLNHRVVRVGSDGRLVTIAGVGQRASTGDNGPATSAAVNQPGGLALDAAGNLYVAELAGHRVRRISPSGTITTYAGTGSPGQRGDGAFATFAQLFAPSGLLLNPAGDLLIADRDNGRIRAVLAAPPPIRLSTSPISVTVTPGNFIQRDVLELPSPIAGLQFEASVRFSGSASGWLTVGPARGTLPGRVGYETNIAGLAAGQYTAQIVITVPGATPRETLIPVTITVPEPPSRPYLPLGNTRITLSAVRGGEATQAVPIANPGGAPLRLTAVAEGDGFLSVTPASLIVPPGQTGTLTVTASAGSLAPGTYRGGVTLTGAGSTSGIGVSFNVAGASSRLVLSQSGLFFRAVNGAAVPRPRNLFASSGDRLVAEAQTVSGAPWLSAAVNGNRVTVSVNPQGLPSGDHYGRIAVFDSASPNVRRYASVLFQVLPSASDPGPDLTPSALYFSVNAGGQPAGQEVELLLPNNRSGSFTATASTTEGSPWLQFFPAGGRFSPSSPARLTVLPDLTGLAPGNYRGTITVLFDNGDTRVLPIMAVVTPSSSPLAKSPEREASNCPSPDLFPQVLAPGANFSATIGEPVRLAVRVVDGCGNLHQPESGGTAGVAVAGLGSQVINLTHVGAGVWESTVTPNAVQSAATLTYLALFSRGTFLQAGAEKISGAITAAQRPVVFSESLTDAASFQFGVPVAPGTLVSLFGTNLNSTSSIPSSLPLPQRLDDVEVRLNDQPIPLLFAGPGQVNAQIPYALNPDAEYQLEIRRGSAIATPQPVVIAQSRPGVFTVDQSGQGQGHIYRALPNGSQVLADAAGAAAAGEVIVIYCNGLGLTAPPVTAGDAAPFSPLAVTANPVAVSIGGQAAAVAFAGLAPGFTGLYQINAVVPAGVAPGGAVPVVLTVAGQASVPVTMGIR